MKLM
ncbi:Putative uncharacterized protein [Lactococcus lactis subsp. lactis A12]|jgi:intraflagellar transport protein 172